MLFIDGQPTALQLPASVELEVTDTDPGLRGDTASGGGNKPATLETGATIQVPLFVNIGDRVKVQTETGAYMSRAYAWLIATRRARPMSRRTEQRRAAVFALYQAEVTDRELGDVLGRDASMFTRALAYAAQDRQPELDEIIGAHARGWTVARIAPLEQAIMRVALVEMLHPDVAPADTPIPPEGAIDEAVETAKEFCGADAPGLRQRHPRRRAARDAATMRRS